MDLYGQVSTELSGILTRRYSTSFSSASRLFSPELRSHIYAIYALVRIADEIVDTYQGDDRLHLLDDLEQEVTAAISRGYSANPLVHAYSLTSRKYGIGADLTAPFFASMRMDIDHQTYTPHLYRTYIHGSAEVVGLMCLKVFCHGNQVDYDRLAPGAAKLGAAYQKVNFLRDIAADHAELGRYYFPNSSFESFDEAAKMRIISETRRDFAAALPYIRALPVQARPAVAMSYAYYTRLLTKLERTPADVIKTTRIRLPAQQKVALFAAAAARRYRL
jgi:phytoene synthase